ncbi:SRPBCC family protein [Tritonibacter aquimaris]|uniref:polyketide cyclase/dehydrase n=1 Tax=Tritonibacter aquimaris TaxID=2663379 RepID=UPI001F1AE1DE|nr:polyketide cyclase/dehydrase [Tritonibacter aquimaris]
MQRFWGFCRFAFQALWPSFVLAGGLLAVYFMALSVGMETIGATFLLGFPIVASFVILKLRPKGQAQTLLGVIAYMFGIMILSIIGAYVFGLEGLLCIVMAVAPLLFGTLLGGMIYVLYLRMKDAKRGGAKLVVVMPLLALMALDGGLKSLDPKVHSISNHVVIAAPPEVVFGMLKSIPDIRPEEVATRFSHLLGVPKPTEARWVIGADGAVVRHSHWGPEVHFQERIVEVVENQKIAWEFEFPEGWVSERIEDPHVRVGGQYFDVLSGGYVLQDLGQQTRLTLTTRTWDHSGLGFYATFWHHFFIEDFHEVVLGLVKARVEAL